MNAVFEIKADVIGTYFRACIQKCLEIGKGKVLDEKELQYIVALNMGWPGGQLDEASY